MNFFLKVLSGFFSSHDPKNITQVEPLRKYEDDIEIIQYIEMGNNSVRDSKDHLFQTPTEVLDILHDNTVLWIDKRNDRFGISNHMKSLIIPLHQVKGFEIQNILQGKGSGESYILVCLSNSKYLMLTTSPITYEFDQYSDILSKTLGVPVTFAPEFYNC
ncbi:hypothetical protein C1637_01850 [Chryseobacterium lactis]|uniref:Uncharacterized protein n=1 Tax=Chryseobacterium lactis TaxID=1241981 RepID=A0A3G6RXN5_CHRLC|nr:hypothetical protein [Chryseobacterium lactis]AZA81341.1 hypothetical protein EG342_05235 [Chryseobacterium lactis]AZB06340.1 hypothetical protein EG341_21360 [Chryseobacterium lactis]PNW15193.1 hypothetical protein C1637_01850 [Chryseobacterium lactis]